MGFNQDLTIGGGQNLATDPGAPVRQVSTRVPGLPGDPQQARLAIGIEAVRLGTTAVIQSLDLKINALPIAESAVESFVAAHYPAIEVEQTHLRNLGTTVARANFSAGDTFTRSLKCGLAGFVAAHRSGMTGVEAVAYVARSVAILAAEALPSEGIALRASAISAAKKIVAAATVDVVSAALGMTPTSVHVPHSAASPAAPAAGALGRHV